MFNKFYKTIHNHYSKFFKIFNFLRYLIPIFFGASILYITIPKFFDYEKKRVDIENFLLSNYQFEINSYNSIKYNIFPMPNISFENVNLIFKENSNKMKVNKVSIFLNLGSIYDKKFAAKKVVINENKLILKIENVEFLLDFFKKIKLKLMVQNLNLDLKKDNESILKIRNINFSNYGFKKNKLKGLVFNKNFEINYNKEKKIFDFQIPEAGINANFKLSDYKKKQLLAGKSKIDILNNYLKLDYLINKKQIVINKSKFRNKYLSLSFQNFINLNPYFEMDLDIKVERVDNKLFSKLNLEKILSKKNIIKKLNGNSKIHYKEKKILNRNLIEEYTSQIYLENGRVNEQSRIRFPGGVVNCKNETTLIDDPVRLYFQCNLNIINFKKFSRYFSISNNLKNKTIKLYFEGSINVFRNKINFTKLNINEIEYIANEEDKIFFKKKFEEILLTGGIFNIFDTQKIKYFINEII